MFRYTLCTLLIALAIWPLALAGLYWLPESWLFPTVPTFIVSWLIFASGDQ